MQVKAAVCQACQTDQTCDVPQDLCCLCLDCREALFEVRDDVVDMLGTDRQSDGRLRDILLRKLCLAQLVAGWMTSDLTSATFAKSEKMERLSMKRNASSLPPLISKVKMLAPPLGK